MSSPLAQYALDDILTKSSTAKRPRLGMESSTPYVHALATKHSSCEMVVRFAATGNVHLDAVPLLTTPGTSVQVVWQPLMELKHVIERRKLEPVTPYKADAWQAQLQRAGLIDRYAHLPEGFRHGFTLNFPYIKTTQSPPNKDSIVTYAQEFQSIIDAEIQKGRYIGPFTDKEVESLIGPFQSSPMSIIPKPGRPGRFHVIQDYSFPHTTSIVYPNPSINSYINPDNFPSTWGTFHVVSLLISRLPPGSQIATRDVSEAYRTIPLHPSQWPGAVVRISDKHHCIDTCLCFGTRPSAGAYGCVADAGLDILRSHGIGPASRWVDDHLFIRIQKSFLAAYNEQRKRWHDDIITNGQHQDGSRIWYGGHVFEDRTLEEFDEDCRFPIIDLSNASPRSAEDARYTCNFDDIDRQFAELGIPWEISKDANFAFANKYIGIIFDLQHNVVYLADEKKSKYLQAIQEWQKRDRHVLADVQKLYGRLLHTTLVVPRGRAYLTTLESMLCICSERPFLPHRPVKGISADLDWWINILQSTSVERAIPRPLTLHDPAAFSDASSSIGIAIVIGRRWRAWKFFPGWSKLDGEKDIGWAEAVGFELLIRHIVNLGEPQHHFRVYGDNQGVVESWKNGRSRNTAVNAIYRRIHSFLHENSPTYSFHPSYVESESNPADPPSRGIYGDPKLLLPTISIPIELQQFIYDAFDNTIETHAS